MARAEDASTEDSQRDNTKVQCDFLARLSKLNKAVHAGPVACRYFNPGVLRLAQDVVSQSRSMGSLQSSRDCCNRCARALSQNLLGSFHAMREYLRTAGSCSDQIDPHLRGNAGLVSRLSELQEAWEIIARYMEPAEMSTALGNALAMVEAAVAMVPAFQGMCSDRDAECFLALPRIILLGIVAEGTSDALLRSLLPHCFGEQEATTTTGKRRLNSQELIDDFKALERFLVLAQKPVSHCAKEIAHSVAWEILFHRVVLGNRWDDADAFDRMEPSLQERSSREMEDFMRHLEAWSIEMQRHSPRDWALLSAALLHSSSGESTTSHDRGAFP